MIFFFFCVLHFAGGFIIILHRFGRYNDCFSFSVIPILPGFVPWAIRNSGLSEAVSKTSSPPLTHGSNPNLCVRHWSQLLIKKKSFSSPLCGDDSDSCWCSTVQGKVDSTDTSNCLKGQTLLVECFFSNSCNSTILFTEKQILLSWNGGDFSCPLCLQTTQQVALRAPFPFFPPCIEKNKITSSCFAATDFRLYLQNKSVVAFWLIVCALRVASQQLFSTVFQF